MVGIQDVSVIASPPARRRPIRTFLAPFDPASLRTALLREKRRGGQSFFVVPRIEDIAPLAERLAQLAPELTVRIAHGGLPADEVDAVMVGFADGEGDVLLATNIIESGLDVPGPTPCSSGAPIASGSRSCISSRPGRPGSRPGHRLSADRSCRRHVRRHPRAAVDAGGLRPPGIGPGDQRPGSGPARRRRLVGDDQAGHIKMIGAALYQRLLERAVRVARGEVAAAEWTPVLNLGRAGAIPVDYVPDPVTRINLYARLERLETWRQIDAFEEELDDRFGAIAVRERSPPAGLWPSSAPYARAGRLKPALRRAGSAPGSPRKTRRWRRCRRPRAPKTPCGWRRRLSAGAPTASTTSGSRWRSAS
jgi:transcription-repair coupling factor (superfamily II helicase)